MVSRHPKPSLSLTNKGTESHSCRPPQPFVGNMEAIYKMSSTTAKDPNLDPDLIFTAHQKTAHPRAVCYVRFFIRYLKINALTIKMLTQHHFESYKEWLLSLRNENGFFYKHSWVLANLGATRTFGNWLTREGHLEKSPFFPFCSKRLEKELLLFHKKSRKRYLKQRQWTLSDTDLVQYYLKSVKTFVSNRHFKELKEKALLNLLHFVQKQSLSLLKLNETHIKQLRLEWYSLEFYPCLPPTDRCIFNWIKAVRSFYRFIYEEGYSQKAMFQEWEDDLLFKHIKEEREKIALEKTLKKRRYSIKEILKAYQKYLKKIYVSYDSCEHHYQYLKAFIRFVVGQGKSFYTVDQKLIAQYEHHLLHYEYQPGRYYTPGCQTTRLLSIKRFYDWFVFRNYDGHHPLKDFIAIPYKKKIAEIFMKRGENRPVLVHVPDAFKSVYRSLLAHERQLGLSNATLDYHERGFRIFFLYLEKVGIEDLKEVDEQVLEDYQHYVHQLKGRQKQQLSAQTRGKYLSSVKTLFNYLLRFRYLEKNPTHCITLPKVNQGLPTVGLTDQEVKKLLKAKEPVTDQEIRDRALLETLYSTGVRSNELRCLCVQDVDLGSGLLRVNVPKGGENYQRVVPIGREACRWIRRYLGEVRSKQKTSVESLFLNKYGMGISNQTILNTVKTYALLKGGLWKNVVTHSFRVSCGTEMLKNSADLKYVQQQLGHRSISSTERYMRLVPMDLKKIHMKCHPREKRNREKKGETLCSSE